LSNLLNLTITTAITAQVGPILQFRPAQLGSVHRHLSVQANFTVGGGGTSGNCYVQTSFDGGANWCDIINFAFTSSSSRRIANLSSLTPVTTLATPTDGSLANNTCIDGFIGPLIRTKVSTTGTYSAATTLLVDIDCNDRTIAQISE
jgi:hypothetical protein